MFIPHDASMRPMSPAPAAPTLGRNGSLSRGCSRSRAAGVAAGRRQRDRFGLQDSPPEDRHQHDAARDSGRGARAACAAGGGLRLGLRLGLDEALARLARQEGAGPATRDPPTLGILPTSSQRVRPRVAGDAGRPAHVLPRCPPGTHRPRRDAPLSSGSRRAICSASGSPTHRAVDQALRAIGLDPPR